MSSSQISGQGLPLPCFSPHRQNGMNTETIVSALNELMPDSKIFADVNEHLQYFAEGSQTTIHVDSKPRRVPLDIPIRIIKKSFSMAYLPDEATTVNVLLAVNFDPIGFDIRQFDPEQHCFGVMQYGVRDGRLFVVNFQTEYWYC
jgi:hypothetical protein